MHQLVQVIIHELQMLSKRNPLIRILEAFQEQNMKATSSPSQLEGWNKSWTKDNEFH